MSSLQGLNTRTYGCGRVSDFSSSKSIQIWVGTFNLNGKGHGVLEDLSAWLRPEASNSQRQPEMVVVGFQEIVELSPQQIMSTDPARRQTWEQAVKTNLNANAGKAGSEEYVLLRSGQLVGAALLVFVKIGILVHVKDVEGSVIKVGPLILNSRGSVFRSDTDSRGDRDVRNGG